MDHQCLCKKAGNMLLTQLHQGEKLRGAEAKHAEKCHSRHLLQHGRGGARWYVRADTISQEECMQLAGRCWVILVELFNSCSKEVCQDSKVKPSEKGMLTWHITGKVTMNQKMLMKKTG